MDGSDPPTLVPHRLHLRRVHDGGDAFRREIPGIVEADLRVGREGYFPVRPNTIPHSGPVEARPENLDPATAKNLLAIMKKMLDADIGTVSETRPHGRRGHDPDDGDFARLDGGEFFQRIADGDMENGDHGSANDEERSEDRHEPPLAGHEVFRENRPERDNDARDDENRGDRREYGGEGDARGDGDRPEIEPDGRSQIEIESGSGTGLGMRFRLLQKALSSLSSPARCRRLPAIRPRSRSVHSRADAR